MKGKINEDFILLLKHGETNNFVLLEHEPVEKLFEKEFISFQQEIGTDTSVKVTLKRFAKFNFLLNSFNYASNLAGAYLSIKDYNNYSGLCRLLKMNKTEIISEFSLRLSAYRFEKACERANKLIKGSNVLAFSHRKIGWNAAPFFLNEKFRVQFNTNFGFGFVSYFYLEVTYKMKKIIPYSDWIVYHQSQIFEIQRYTRKYVIEDESWQKAFEDCATMFNLSISNETEFINKYIIEEAKSMVNGLENIMKSEEFTLLNWNKDKISIRLDRIKVLEYRAEKISGALKFISDLMQFKDHKQILDLIATIKKLNLQLYPILKNEYNVIINRIQKLEPICIKLKPIAERLSAENGKIMNRHNEILDELYVKYNYVSGSGEKLMEIMQQEIKKRIIQEIPSSEETQNEYKRIAPEYYPMKSEMEKLIQIRENLFPYLTEMENYFSRNNILN